MGEFDQGEDWARVRKDLQELKAAREQSESAEMNEVEKARLAKTLGLASKSWEFMEGYIPKALRKGVWVILDEMNLAEPQVLERLNSVLEDGHELVLTEGEGTIFAKGGDVEPHDDFRLFGTMNPAEYAGRSTLSPAYRDRWQMWRFVDLPMNGVCTQCCVVGVLSNQDSNIKVSSTKLLKAVQPILNYKR